MGIATPCATTSRLHTPWTGMPRTWPSMRAVTSPIRNPVNGPGPTPTAISVSSRRSTPAELSTPTIAGPVANVVGLHIFTFNNVGSTEAWRRELLASLTDDAGAVAEAVTVPLIASGGAGALEHFAPAVDAGADAVLAASVFHFGALRIRDVKRAVAAAGHPVR